MLERDSKPNDFQSLMDPDNLAANRWIPSGRGVVSSVALDSADSHNVESDPINVVVALLLLIAGLIVLFSRRRKIGRLLQANWPIVLFFSYCAVSTLWSDYTGAAFRKVLRSFGDVMMVLIVLSDSKPVAALKSLLVRAGFVLLPLAVLLIKYYPDWGRAYANDWELMYTGVTDHKNSLGAICMVFGLGLLWCCLESYRAKGAPHRLLHLFAVRHCFCYGNVACFGWLTQPPPRPVSLWQPRCSWLTSLTRSAGSQGSCTCLLQS